jgi:hypothetical protein
MLAWVIVLVVVLLLGGLAALFVAHARAIQRDVDERYRLIQVRLEQQAKAVLRHLLREI